MQFENNIGHTGGYDNRGGRYYYMDSEAQVDDYTYPDDYINYQFPKGTHDIPGEDIQLNPYITIIVLVAGVVGGLVIVISVILFCKYCIKDKNLLKRQPAVFSKNRSGRRYDSRRYLTLDSSSGFSNTDSDSYHVTVIYGSKENLQKQEPNEEKRLLNELPELANIALGETDGKAMKSIGRRVSFHLSEQNEMPSQSYFNKGRRYTDGDFHHLRNAKISRHSRMNNVRHSRSLALPDRRQDSNIHPKPFKTIIADTCIMEVDETTADASSLRDLKFHENCIRLKPIQEQPSTESEKSVSSKDKGARRRSYEDVKRPNVVDISTNARRNSDKAETAKWQVTYIRESERTVASRPDPAPPPQDNRAIVITTINDDQESDGRPTPRNVVRYNDMGSFEQVSDTSIDLMDDSAVKAIEAAEQEVMRQKYKELWNLRATLEEDDEEDEEDDASDAAQADNENLSEVSPEQGDQTDPGGPSTSFESNTDSPCPEENTSSRPTPSSNLLCAPTYQARRQTYKNILSKHLQKLEANTSTENSFDSIDTEGSELSSERQGGITTSFESTTDNTDSTGDSQSSKRLQQMKSDSGYKSIENQQKTQPAATSVTSDRKVGELERQNKADPVLKDPAKHVVDDNLLLERRNAKTASKKRRDYGRERQFASSLFEPVLEPMDGLTTNKIIDNSLTKTPVFTRFFKSNSEVSDIRERPRNRFDRDYSIDEKTDALFKEFIKPDIYEEIAAYRSRSPRVHHRHKLRHRQYSFHDDNGRARRLSPQDSIEEEQHSKTEEPASLELVTISSRTPVLQPIPRQGTIQLKDIPIIKLPEGETA